jgi:predicted GIY-YIG superfamily endonuclease
MAIKLTEIPKPKTWHSYLILHPVSQVPIYAGMTGNPENRLREHAGPNSKIRDHLASLGEPDLLPVMVLVAEFTSRDEALEHETHLIGYYPGLINVTVKSPYLAGQTNEAQKPWIAKGMSRATWYRRQKEMAKR